MGDWCAWSGIVPARLQSFAVCAVAIVPPKLSLQGGSGGYRAGVSGRYHYSNFTVAISSKLYASGG